MVYLHATRPRPTDDTHPENGTHFGDEEQNAHVKGHFFCRIEQVQQAPLIAAPTSPPEIPASTAIELWQLV